MEKKREGKWGMEKRQAECRDTAARVSGEGEREIEKEKSFGQNASLYSIQT